MTPEQEDAHWALMGKPLMRHWRERRRLMMASAECERLAGATSILEERAALADQAKVTRAVARAGWSAVAPNYKWTPHGHVVDGVLYLWGEWRDEQ